MHPYKEIPGHMSHILNLLKVITHNSDHKTSFRIQIDLKAPKNKLQRKVCQLSKLNLAKTTINQLNRFRFVEKFNQFLSYWKAFQV